jgi:type III restriction enzyme
VADCFAGRPKVEGITYRLDPGKLTAARPQSELDYGTEAFRNAGLLLDEAQLLENIQKVQRRRNLPQSKALVATKSAAVNLDVEMETGTGKTYVYIRTMFELNRRYGWSKFIVVVPSIAIREGIQKSLEITSEHFLQDYSKRIRFFTYDSKHPHKLESFSSDGSFRTDGFNISGAANASSQAQVSSSRVPFISAPSSLPIVRVPSRCGGIVVRRESDSSLSTADPVCQSRRSVRVRG